MSDGSDGEEGNMVHVREGLRVGRGTYVHTSRVCM